MNNPLVSIIVPCYLQAVYLSEALETVINQTYENWECIIINDGSPDNTGEVVKEWLKKDKRFGYIKSENRGVSFARNLGIEKAKGTYILPLDADDKIALDYVEKAVEEFTKDDALQIVYGKAERFGAVTGVWNLKNFSLYNLALANMIYCSALYKRTEWERVNGYDVKMVNGLEDWEFWISMLKDGGKVKQMDTIVFYYRIKEKSRNKGFDEEEKNDMFDYLCAKHPDFFIKTLGSSIALKKQTMRLEKQLNHLKKSKKHAVNVLIKSLFGLTKK